MLTTQREAMLRYTEPIKVLIVQSLNSSGAVCTLRSSSVSYSSRNFNLAVQLFAFE